MPLRGDLTDLAARPSQEVLVACVVSLGCARFAFQLALGPACILGQIRESNRNPLDLIEGHFVPPAVIELCCALESEGLTAIDCDPSGAGGLTVTVGNDISSATKGSSVRIVAGKKRSPAKPSARALLADRAASAAAIVNRARASV